jgi:hypothetical protein
LSDANTKQYDGVTYMNCTMENNFFPVEAKKKKKREGEDTNR